MADYADVIRKTNVRVMLGSVIARCGRIRGVFVDYEGALNVDRDGAGGEDGLING